CILGENPFTLMIGVAERLLADLHRAHRVECSAYVTAVNPFSRAIDAAKNADRQATLEDEIRRTGFDYVRGVGRHPSGTWPGEPSILILGMPMEDAKVLGVRHEQNAIVWCGSNAVPQLILLR
ncbi:DUF3293 domain-containing protein, partial [Caballeronia sp.]|uniref:DUF3293 domain-containing protein n=1 Tax=Caballeronia sp. TaxID=1931223 RepID=UPI003C68B23E